MAQWRIELATQDVVALSDGREVTVSAFDEDAEGGDGDTIDVTITLLDV